MSKTERALTFFEIISETEQTYKCTLCNQIKKGKKHSNLVAHLFSAHREAHDDRILPKIDHVTAKRMQLKLIQCMVEKITFNGRPFASLNDSGFVKSIEDKLDILKSAGLGINLAGKKYEQIKEYISKTTNQIKEKIAAETKGRHVSLMLDVASKNHHSILGVNVRYIIDGKIVERCIGMINLTEKHTAKHLAKETKMCLDKFEIRLKQIISITSDNGRNVVNIVDELEAETFNAFEEDEDSCLDSLNLLDAHNDSVVMNTDSNSNEPVNEDEMRQLVEQIEEEEALEAALDDTEEYDEMLNELIGELPHHVRDNTFGIRCGAHTLQLMAKGGLKSSDFQWLIVLCRKIAKLLRTESYMREMRNNDIEFILPRLNVLTRWDSDYTMVMHVYISNFKLTRSLQ